MSRNLAVSLGRRAFALAAAPSVFVVAVTDVRGKPWANASVTMMNGGFSTAASTDIDGIVKLEYPAGPMPPEIIFVAKTQDGAQQGTHVPTGQALSQVTTFRFATAAPVPFMTLKEGLALGSGLLLALFGYYKDGTLGNVVGTFGSTVAFSAIASSVRRHI